MARPIVLIKEDLLAELYRKYMDGVKYRTLVRRHELPIASPTLKYLLQHYSFVINTSGFEHRLAYESLFPEWLTEPVQRQDTTKWAYYGTMPLGKWEHCESGV